MRKLIIFLLLFYASFFYGATYTVSDANGLISSLSQVNDGDTIQLRSGTYEGREFAINNDITLEGLGTDKTDVRIIHNGLASLLSNAVFKVNANNVTFQNLSISSSIAPISIQANPGGTYRFINTDIQKKDSIYLHSGIYTRHRVGSIIVMNSIVEGYDALNIDTNTLQIDNSTILTHDTGTSGVRLREQATQVIIDRSKVLESKRGAAAPNGFGVDLKANNILIRDSVIEGRTDGIVIRDSNNVLIRNTNASAIAGGINLGGSGAITAAINVRKAQTLTILGGKIVNKAITAGTRGVLIDDGVENTTMDYVCMDGGNYNIGISPRNGVKNLDIRHSVMSNWVSRGMWYEDNAIIGIRNSCLMNNTPLEEGRSHNNPQNSFLGNYWVDVGAINVHDLGTSLSTCPIINDCTYKVWSFDGWDTFRDTPATPTDDRNISTKIVNNSFNLKINALNEQGTAFQNFITGTVCTQVVDEANNSLSGGWQTWKPNDEDSTTVNYTVPVANKNAKIAIVWRYGIDDTCPITDRTETGKMLSTDNFAIRPNDFNITAPIGVQKAKSTMNLEFNGRDINGSRANSYDERQGDTFRVDINESGMTNCIQFEPSNYNLNWRFSDGYKEMPLTLYKEGDLNVSISDTSLTCNNLFAAVDCDDKNVTNFWNTNTGVPIGYTSTIVKWACPCGFFEVWDTFRDTPTLPPDDRNISTKIVEKNFDVVLASINRNRTEYKDFNGTVCARVEENGHPLTSWQKHLFLDENKKTATFTASKASKNAKVHLVWKNDEDISCPIQIGNENNSTQSVDSFAIRPNNFNITAPTNIHAGANFNITFEGQNGVGTNTSDYNETKGTSFEVNFKERSGTTCVTGVFDGNFSSPWSFANGSHQITTNYSEVGIVDINISDTSLPCNALFAAVDCNDRNVSGSWNTTTDLPIGEANHSVSLTPDHFDINSNLQNISAGTFTYLATLDGNPLLEDMSATLDMSISARNANGGITRNYSSVCYAQPTDINVSYSTSPITPAGRLTEAITYETNTTRTTNVPIGNIIELNAMPTSMFDDGSASLGLRINFNRDFSQPVNPFDINISDINITDSSGISELGEVLGGNATFYYGRVKADELLYQVSNSGGLTRLLINYEIYDTTSRSRNSGWLQNSMQWYRNELHTGTLTSIRDSIYGRVEAATPSKIGESIPISNNDLSGTDTLGPFDPSSPRPGIAWIQFSPRNVTVSSKISLHLEVNPWLWHTDTFNPQPYQTTGSCSQHPCANINIFGGREHTKSIISGDINGSDVNMVGKKSQRVRESGIKVFR